MGPGQPLPRIRRSRTAILGAAAVLAFGLLAAGCGGGDEVPPPDAAAAAGEPAVAAETPGVIAGAPADGATPGIAVDATTPPADAANVPGANEIASTDAAPGNAVKISAITPKAFAKAHCAKPVLVVMHTPGAILDDNLVRAANAALVNVKGSGVVSLFYTPKQVKVYGDLPSKLGLLSTPGLATVSRDGSIENFWTTYVDQSLITRSLQNAARAKPCKVSTDDVPATAAASALSNAASLVAGNAAAPAPGATAATSTGSPAYGSSVPSSVPGASGVATANGIAATANGQMAALPTN